MRIINMQKIKQNIVFQFLSMLCCFVFLCTIVAQAQQEMLFENYTSINGLSQNSCYSIEQDADGFMWFGTQDGLNRYDGKEFKVYLPTNKIGKNLPSNNISTLFFDKAKRCLWIGTNRGLCLYASEKDEVQKLSTVFPFAASLDSLSIRRIISFAADEYWVITDIQGLFFLNTKKETTQQFFTDKEQNKKVTAITIHHGKIYASLFHELYELDVINKQYSPKRILPDFVFKEISELYSYHDELWIGNLYGGCFRIKNDVEDKKNMTSFQIQIGGFGSFIEDNENNLWMGTKGNGIIRYNATTGILSTAMNNKYNTRTIGKNFVLSLFKDRQGLIWCGLSGGGVAKYDPNSYRFTNILNEPINPHSLPDNMVFDIFKASDNNYYVGTQNKGLTAFNRQNNHFVHFKQSESVGEVSNTIYDITEDEHQHLWIATWGGLMKLDLKTKKISFTVEKSMLPSTKLYGIHKLKKADSLFLCGENDFIFYSLKENRWKPVQEKTWQSKRFVGRYVYEDAYGILWICTVGNGLIRYDYRNNALSFIESVRQHGLAIRHLLPDGDLFYLSTDNGIIIYNWKKDKLEKQISVNSTNISNVCYATQKDSLGNIWVSSNNGLYKINTQDYALHNFDIGDGLSFLEYNTACTITESDGSFLFGGVGGITRFNPQQLTPNTFSPQPIITSMMVNDSLIRQDFIHKNAIELAFNQNFITLTFAVNNFSNQNKNSFAYQLIGIDKNWVNSENKNIARYTSLPPGSYVFQLKSANSDGIWCQDPITFNIVIRQPWWKTWWFLLLSFLVLLSSFIAITRRRIKVIKQQADLKHKLVEVEMKALRLQMNPHFMFNTLNSINSYIIQNKTEIASEYLTTFSKLMRRILDLSKQEKVNLEKELEALKMYMELESLRLEQKFDYSIRVDHSIDENAIFIPPLTLQPFVENAIWHGLHNKIEPGNIIINITEAKGDLLQITIEDDGIGRKAAAVLKKDSTGHKSYGIDITINRIKLANPANTVTIVDNYDADGKASGTTVTLLLQNDSDD